jgi:hypothetical protein
MKDHLSLGDDCTREPLHEGLHIEDQVVGGLCGRFRRRCSRIIEGSAVAIALFTGSAVVSGCERDSSGVTQTSVNPTSQGLFKYLRLDDKNKDGKINEKAWVWSTNEGYEDNVMMDLDNNGQIDAREAWVHLCGSSTLRNFVSARPNGEFTEVQNRLQSLFNNASSLSEYAQENLLEALIGVGIMNKDMNMFEMAFSLSDTLRVNSRYLGVRESLFRTAVEGDSFFKTRVVPFLCKLLNQGKDKTLLYSWINALVAHAEDDVQVELILCMAKILTLKAGFVLTKNAMEITKSLGEDSLLQLRDRLIAIGFSSNDVIYLINAKRGQKFRDQKPLTPGASSVRQSNSSSDESRRPWDEIPCLSNRVDCQMAKQESRMERLRRDDNDCKAKDEEQKRRAREEYDKHRDYSGHSSGW